jgi:hypothetical protein
VLWDARLDRLELERKPDVRERERRSGSRLLPLAGGGQDRRQPQTDEPDPQQYGPECTLSISNQSTIGIPNQQLTIPIANCQSQSSIGNRYSAISYCPRIHTPHPPVRRL